MRCATCSYGSGAQWGSVGKRGCGNPGQKVVLMGGPRGRPGEAGGSGVMRLARHLEGDSERGRRD